MSTHLVEVERSTTIQEAAEKMDVHDVGSVLVVEAGMPIGIVTEADFTRKVVVNSIDSSEPISRIMSSPIHFVAPEADLMQAAHAFRTNHIKKLPVVRGDRLYGMVTQTDVIRHIVSTIQELARQYTKGSLSSKQYADQAAALFHTFHNSLDDVTRNWHMRCQECDYRFLAAERKGKLNMSRCPHCSSSKIIYDQNPPDI